MRNESGLLTPTLEIGLTASFIDHWSTCPDLFGIDHCKKRPFYCFPIEVWVH